MNGRAIRRLGLGIALSVASACGEQAEVTERGAIDTADLPGQIVYISEHGDNHDVVSLVPATGEQRTLASNRDGVRHFPALAWPLVTIAVAGPEDAKSEWLTIARHGGEAPIRLGEVATTVRNPSWSPDRRWLVYESDAVGFRELYRTDVTTGESRQLTSDRAGNFEPDVSPDGADIAFTSSRDDNAEIYRMRADGSAPVRLTSTQLDDWLPIWSPDGRHIAFSSDRGGLERLYVMNRDGDEQRPLNGAGAWAEDSAAWSSDGQLIAYRVITAEGASEIWTTELATGARQRLSPAGAHHGPPRWSPDDAYIAYTERTERRTDIYVMRADGTGAVRITDEPGHQWLPRWFARSP